GPPVLARLDDPLVVPGGGSRPVMSPDGSRLAFVGELDTGPATEATAFSVLTDGSYPPVQLGQLDGLLPHGDVLNFVVTPDDSRALYLADQDVAGRFKLYSVRVDGSQAPLKLNLPLPAGGNVEVSTVPAFFVSPDSQRVVYRADQLTNGVDEL